MPLRSCHPGDFHLDEDRHFSDTAQCLEWFVADAIQVSVDLFEINGDLTTYEDKITEREGIPTDGTHMEMPFPPVRSEARGRPDETLQRLGYTDSTNPGIRRLRMNHENRN